MFYSGEAHSALQTGLGHHLIWDTFPGSWWAGCSLVCALQWVSRSPSQSQCLLGLLLVSVSLARPHWEPV